MNENVLPAEEMVTVLSAARQCGHRDVADAEGEVLVNLVGDDDRVMLPGEFDDALKHLAREDRAGRVVRVVQQHHLGAVVERRLEGCRIGKEIGGQQWCGDMLGAGEPMMAP